MTNDQNSHLIASAFDTCYQRDYHVKSPELRRLYENAKRDQWNAARDIDWRLPVDLNEGIFPDELIDGRGVDCYDRADAKRKAEINVEFSCWRISQLLHGEEGAMLLCSQLVDVVPGNDAKLFQTTQTIDEARHVEALSRYLLDKCGGRIYPVSPNLKQLFDYLLGGNPWFIKTIGLQLIAETFAVSLFRLLGETVKDPLLGGICRRILSDESRHMGFAILSLPEEIASLNAAELREVEDFTRLALDLVTRGQFPREAYEKVGFNSSEIGAIRSARGGAAAGNEAAHFRRLFRREMHSTIVANLNRVGLLTDRIGGYLRELGINPETTSA